MKSLIVGLIILFATSLVPAATCEDVPKYLNSACRQFCETDCSLYLDTQDKYAKCEAKRARGFDRYTSKMRPGDPGIPCLSCTCWSLADIELIASDPLTECFITGYGISLEKPCSGESHVAITGPCQPGHPGCEYKHPYFCGLVDACTGTAYRYYGIDASIYSTCRADLENFCLEE